MKARYVIFIETLKLWVSKVLGQVFETGHTEQIKKLVQKDQSMLKLKLSSLS